MLRRGLSLATCHALLFIHTSSPFEPTTHRKIPRTGVVRNLQNADVATRLASIEKAIEAQRKEENIPGVALVIVK
jgi:hypothetical protein